MAVGRVTVLMVAAACALSACTADVSGRDDLGRSLRISGNCANASAVDLEPGQTGSGSFATGNTCEVFAGGTFEYLGCLVVPDGAQDFAISRYFDARRQPGSCG